MDELSCDLHKTLEKLQLISVDCAGARQKLERRLQTLEREALVREKKQLPVDHIDDEIIDVIFELHDLKSKEEKRICDFLLTP